MYSFRKCRGIYPSL